MTNAVDGGSTNSNRGTVFAVCGWNYFLGKIILVERFGYNRAGDKQDDEAKWYRLTACLSKSICEVTDQLDERQRKLNRRLLFEPSPFAMF